MTDIRADIVAYDAACYECRGHASTQCHGMTTGEVDRWAAEHVRTTGHRVELKRIAIMLLEK